MPSNNNIYKMSNAGGFKSLTRYTDMLAGNAVWNPWEPAGAYESIAVATVPSGGAASVAFTSIPQTYQHLQIRGISRPTEAGSTGAQYVYLNMNSDTGTNYSRHSLTGDGSAATAQAAASDSVIRVGYQLRNGFAANIFATSIIDILDYKNTNKNKVVRSLNGFDANGAGYIALNSGSWMNTNAVTSLTLTCEVGSFVQFSQFALYGIKG